MDQQSAAIKDPMEWMEDLKDVTMHQRRFKSFTGWDVMPVGYENDTRDEILRKDPQRLVRMQAETRNPVQAHLSRQIVIENIPPSVDHASFKVTIEDRLRQLGRIRPDAIKKITMLPGGVAEVDFADPSVAEAALSMSIQVGNQTLRVGRSQAYKNMVKDNGEMLAFAETGGITTTVPNSLHKLLISDLPVHFSADDVKSILTEVGPLEEFDLIVDPLTSISRRMAFVKYVDPAHASALIKLADDGGLALEVGTVAFNPKVERAVDTPIGQKAAYQTPLGALPGAHACILKPGQLMNIVLSDASTVPDGAGPPTRTIVIINAITPIDILSSGHDIAMDMAAKATTLAGEAGAVESIVIPRPLDTTRTVPGLGRVFIRLKSPETASRALEGLCGLRYMGRKLMVGYYDDVKFDAGDFSGGTMRVGGQAPAPT